MKFNKKFLSIAMTGVLLATSIAFAAPATRNLVANYGVTLNVNGSNFTVSDDSMRPFTTQDGRVYVSVAALNQMGLATINYIPASKTVQLKGSAANNTALQAQVNAQTAENSRLLAENNKLKQEIEELKKGSSSSSNKTGDKLSTLSSSERTSLAKDIRKEIRSELRLRGNSVLGGQRFEGDATVRSNSVTLDLYTSTDFSIGNDKTDWNDAVKTTRDRQYLEDDLEDFMDEDVRDFLDSILKDYSGYDIEVNIYPNSDYKSAQLMATVDYTDSRDRVSVSVYEIK